MNRVANEFDIFCQAVFPPDLSKQQRIDLKRTFYAGIAAFFILAVKYAGESEEDTITAIQMELLHFNEDVKAGRA